MVGPGRGILSSPTGADTFREDCGCHCGPNNEQGAVMSGSHAEEIVGDYFDPDDWTEQMMDEAEPDLDLPPLPPPQAA
jgi:hypothetical protein